jgi:glycosyltransferase involved in cell wall biosynthesis
VPAYNEAATLAELIEQLFNKMIDGLEIEGVLVESNSTDASRDLVLRYKKHPRVMLILEDTPKGKGHPVRNALKAATGEMVLFQDAGLEYDIDDCDAFVAPLLRFQNNFVLGSRHSINKNRWKIRQFSDSPGLATLKAYEPLELPANYTPRSLSEGKKVTVFRDPLTWIRALVKFRNTALHRDRRSR